MSSQQQLTVKAYLKRGGQQKRLLDQSDEIRRFGVDHDVATNYEYMLAKITNVFPGLVNRSITLYWKDTDGDMIAFSSDDELMEAIKAVTDGIFRVFIIEKKQPRTELPFVGEVLHPFVTCDGCNGEIRGIRFKCKVCPDYDLCSKCKASGLHPEHEMFTIERPCWPGWCRRFDEPTDNFPHPMPPCMGPPGPPPPGCPRMGPPGPPGCGPMGPPPPPYGCFGPPPPPEAGVQDGDSAESRRRTRRAWKRWYLETYGRDHRRKNKKEKKENEEKNEKEKSSEKTSSSNSSDSDADNSPTGEYLRNVGDSVATMLDPLGIDVEVDVEHRGHLRRCRRMMGGHHGHGHCHGLGGWGLRMRGGACGGPWGMRGGGGWRGGRGPWGCPWRQPFNATVPQDAAAANPSENPSESQNVGSTDPQQKQTADLQTTGHPNSETGEMASGVSPPENGWTLVNNADGAQADVEGATTGVRNLDVSDGGNPQMMSVAAASPPGNPDISEALQTMLSMGYSNEGGWLTNLLVYHQGDIGRVLDAMNAKRQP